MSGDRPFVRKAAEIEPVPCPCGQSRRIVTGRDNDRASIHRVSIDGRAQTHYHQRLTEYYIVLDGTGVVELDGEEVLVEPGDVIYIPPGTRHALHGRFEIINVVVPPFDAADEFVTE
ncbi:MAG: cupin domain-containing protein [Candidatus Hydrogenedentes bacterium]|nr:cupin domain-containing protein [Candidatus Hydrogenedentota bacterium]